MNSVLANSVRRMLQKTALNDEKSLSNESNDIEEHEPTSCLETNDIENSISASRGGGDSMKCFNCQQHGHKSRDCPNAVNRPPQTCRRCNEEGHMVRDCPKPDTRPPQTCRRCNEEGHMSRDCPMPDTRPPQTCHRCNQEGHMVRDCPNPDTRPPQTCRRCNEEGHMSRDCPKPDTRPPQTCRRCNEEGHMSRDCPMPDTRPPQTCHRCNQEGHMARDCPNPDIRPPRTCRKCNEEGHMARDCPNAGSDPAFGESGSPKKCFKCNEEGHMSRECPKADPNDENPPPQNFMPPDVDVNETSKFMNRGIRFENYERIQVRIEGDNPPNLITSFKEAELHPAVESNVNNLHFQRPTPVQKGAIPVIHCGRDLIGCAQTGSGKTAAFLLPIISNILKEKDTIPKTEPAPRMSVAAPKVIILSPTRELVEQTYSHALMFCKDTGLVCSFLYGGLDMFKSRAQLTKGGCCDILCATIGRFMDFLIKRSWVSLAHLRYFVLDEADKMLEASGFHDAISQIITLLTERQQKPQMLMFSATFPPVVRDVAERLLSADHLFLRVGMVGAASAEVTQEIWKVSSGEKTDKLHELVFNNRDKKIIVFCERKQQADYLGFEYAQQFPEGDKNIVTLHGSRTPEQRHFVMHDFKRMEGFGILFATSCAARGLDIPCVDLVVNFDLPNDIDTYVHRIGRTGRCGLTGQSISFYDPQSDRLLAAKLYRVLCESQQMIPDWLAEEAKLSANAPDNSCPYGGPRRKEKIVEVCFDGRN